MYLEELEKLVSKEMKACGYDIKSKIIVSNRPDLCDYQCDDAFKIAKTYHKNPITVGEEITNKLIAMDNSTDYFKQIEFIKPGFINFTLSDKFISTYIREMKNNDKFGLREPEQKELFYVDYGGANIAKPLHVGHLRPAIIGESISRIMKFIGHKTLGDAHLGDYGLQIGEVIYALLRDFKDTKVEDINFDIEYLDYTYPEMSKSCKEDPLLLEKCQIITKELQEGNETYMTLWRKICKVSLEEVKSLYNFLGVDFDFWDGESACYPIIPELKDVLEQKGIVSTSEGAKVIHVKNEYDQKEIPPFILEKSNGASLYSTTDLACIYERMNKFSPNHILYVVDARQGLHFEQVFRASNIAGFTPNTSLEHIGFGTINGKDGKPFKTRDGGAAKLRDLITQVKEVFLSLKETNKDMSDSDINKIVNAIIKFADLQNNLERNYVFDIEKFASVIGKTGPYILYTYLRINKMIKDIKIDNELSDTIYNNFDRDLRLKLLEMESAVMLAAKERRPHYVADYLYQLCVATNNFYQNNYLTNLEDEQKRNDWILLLQLTANVLESLLDLLVIETPSIM